MLHIFDCDGVLVDSEILVCRIESELLCDVGVGLSPEEIAATFVGLSDAEMHRRIEQEWEIRLPPDFSARKTARVEKVLEGALRPVAGVPALLRTLDTRRCVASSSALPRIRRSLTATGLSAFFEPHLFSASMVTDGKPAPDLFEYAAASMDADAVECVVVEDSVYGITAARAAGMYVIGFTGGAHCGPVLAADLRRAGAHEITRDAAELGLALTRSTPS